MNRALTTGRPGARIGDNGGHPDWCAQAHHCTAHTMPAGEHASIPEVWRTDLGRLVATRYRDRHGHDRVELRAVVALADDDPTAQRQARHLIAVTYAVLQRLFGPPTSTDKSRKDTYGA